MTAEAVHTSLYRWELPRPAHADLGRIPDVLRQVLLARGFTSYAEAKAFLEAHPPEGTQDPFALQDMDRAVDRLAYAVRRGEPIAVYGDYDVDGVTATALLVQVLQELGAQVQPYIPNRFDEGYGLNVEALQSLKEEGMRLVVSVDCGIRAHREAQAAREMGLDLIITDHHHPAETLPEARAVINPKRPDDPYPEKHLTGVGLAYKLAQALLHRLAPQRASWLRKMLDLVALGTIADVAPLVGENRHLVRLGLHQLRHPWRQGLFSLMGVAGLRPERVTSMDVAFALAPRLNAAGRLDTAYTALRLLLTQDVWEAGQLAQQLNLHNRRRQQMTETMLAQAEALALEDDAPLPWLLFAAHPEFHSGVVGLVAARLVERYYRPAVVVELGEEWSRGSCRSIPEFHITQALDRCRHLLEHYGGHSLAAGFTIRTRHLPELKACLTEQARAALADVPDLRPSLFIDAVLTLRDINLNLLRLLRWLEPTGAGNPPATFLVRDVRVRQVRPMGSQQQHLSLKLEDDTGLGDAVAFGKASWAGRFPQRIDLVGQLLTDVYNDVYSVKLLVLDWRPA